MNVGCHTQLQKKPTRLSPHDILHRYEIKDDIPIETKLEDKLVLEEASASLTPSNKEDANADSADTDSAVARQNQLNEKQAQGKTL